MRSGNWLRVVFRECLQEFPFALSLSKCTYRREGSFDKLRTNGLCSALDADLWRHEPDCR